MLLGQRLREVRKLKGETLRDTSNDVGLSVSYLSDIERGRTNPSLQTLETLASHFNLSVTDLLSGVEFAGQKSEKSYPPGLYDLLSDQELGKDIDDEWVELLLKINLRGNRPQTKQEWYELFSFMKRILESK